jgi:hypothetical protein
MRILRSVAAYALLDQIKLREQKGRRKIGTNVFYELQHVKTLRNYKPRGDRRMGRPRARWKGVFP